MAGRIARHRIRTRILGVAIAAALGLPCGTPSAAGASFDVYLQGFTDNAATEHVAYLRMYVTLAEPILSHTCTIGSAAAGWWAGTPMCFMDGPAVILEAFDHWGGNPLLDGRLFTITSNASAIGIDRIYFWNEGEIGPSYPNLYPTPVTLIDFTPSSATFSADPSPVATSTWGRVKARYR